MGISQSISIVDRDSNIHYYGNSVVYDERQINKWEIYNKSAYFKLEPSRALGLKIYGPRVFGNIVFEISDDTDKVIIDLDIRSEQGDLNDEIVIKNKRGMITVDTPRINHQHGIYAGGLIQIPSSLLGTSGLPYFEFHAPYHKVDFSNLPYSLNIETFKIHLDKGLIRTGPVQTNTAVYNVASGSIEGELAHARSTISIKVASGSLDLDMQHQSEPPSHTDQANSEIQVGSGCLKGIFLVCSSTTLAVASGSMDVAIVFAASSSESDSGSNSDAHPKLSTQIASGNASISVLSIPSSSSPPPSSPPSPSTSISSSSSSLTKDAEITKPNNAAFRSRHIATSGNQNITYPSTFQGTIDVRKLTGDIDIGGKGLLVQNIPGRGMIGQKGDAGNSYVGIESVSGNLKVRVV